MKDIDCNDCGHLNITEEMQRELGRFYGGIHKKDDHICLIYRDKLYHRVSSQHRGLDGHHPSRIFPCDKCEKDNYIFRKTVDN